MRISARLHGPLSVTWELRTGSNITWITYKIYYIFDLFTAENVLATIEDVFNKTVDTIDSIISTFNLNSQIQKRQYREVIYREVIYLLDILNFNQ